MPKTPYLTAPVPSTKMPGGIPYIIGNEAAERFSFYGMKSILVVFMTQHLLDMQGQPAPMTEPQAKVWYHMFVASAYFFPIFGAIISDAWWGKYNTILRLSIVYCLGHVALSVDVHRLGLFLGLALIALGSGGIKPCVSAHVGDQFGKTNAALQTKGFGWFYLSINFGSFISTGMTPWLLEHYGPHVAFGVPAILMFIATLAFWAGRYKFVHIPAKGWANVGQSFVGEGKDALLRLAPVFACVAVFWSVYDQHGSSWVLQASKMDRRFLGTELLPAQIQVINPILILVLIPFLTYVGYPLINRVFPLTPLRKVSLGFFLAVLASALIAWPQHQIEAGLEPSIAWQIAAYFVITIAEVMVWVTCLEFSYTQAPREMKSLVMSVALLSIFLGNLVTMAVNLFIQNPDGSLRITDTQYFWLFTGLMLVASIVFIPIASGYRAKSYLQEERPADQAL